jgi:hypothetical protein
MVVMAFKPWKTPQKGRRREMPVELPVGRHFKRHCATPGLGSPLPWNGFHGCRQISLREQAPDGFLTSQPTQASGRSREKGQAMEVAVH